MSDRDLMPFDWSVSDNSVWGFTQWGARVRLANGVSHSPMNGVDTTSVLRTMAAAPDLVRCLGDAICYGCSRRYGDNSASALREARGCVSCTGARLVLARVDGEEQG